MVKFPLSPLPERLHDGLERLAALQRLEQLQAAGPQGLTPTQYSILRLLNHRAEAGLRVKTIARELGLSQPTVTDSLLALERKFLIERRNDPKDGRANLIHPSAEGRAALASIAGQMPQMETALAGLTRKEQAALLHIIIKMIRALLHEQAMPVQRMCATCPPQCAARDRPAALLRPGESALRRGRHAGRLRRACCGAARAAGERVADIHGGRGLTLPFFCAPDVNRSAPPFDVFAPALEAPIRNELLG